MNYYRQRKKPQQHHADDWLMTFADMITLLLCFFVVFFSASTNALKKAPVEKPVKPLTEQVFIVPNILEGHLPLQGKQYTTALTGEDAVEAEPVKTVMPLPQISFLQSQDGVTIEQKGDRITTLEMASGSFFGTGSAALSEAGKAILLDVSATLKDKKYKDYTVTVEGHTDDSAINTFQFPSNWELSTARAAAVVRFFIEQGLPAQRLRAAGYAEAFPKLPNHDLSGVPLPENQRKNRRVVIKLDKLENNP